MKKRIKLNYIFILALITMFTSGGLLIHDLLVYGIVPLFRGNFYMITYLGLFIDISALFLLEASLQYVNDTIKKTV